MSDLEATFRVDLNDKERATYIEALSALAINDLNDAIDDCKRSWRPEFGVNFPPIYDLLDFAMASSGRRILVEKSKEIIQREDKPKDWQEANRIHLNISKQQINAWLEEGKQTQREHAAQLARDLNWQKLYEQFGRPGLKPPKSRTWETPEEKYKWKRDMEVSQGWRRDDS